MRALADRWMGSIHLSAIPSCTPLTVNAPAPRGRPSPSPRRHPATLLPSPRDPQHLATCVRPSFQAQTRSPHGMVRRKRPPHILPSLSNREYSRHAKVLTSAVSYRSSCYIYRWSALRHGATYLLAFRAQSISSTGINLSIAINSCAPTVVSKLASRSSK